MWIPSAVVCASGARSQTASRLLAEEGIPTATLTGGTSAWAGQGHDVVIDDLVRLYDSMKDREMREQLIFVYSQRREEPALDKLFDTGKNDPDRELRKKAIFWIGQSRSPKAAKYLQDLINQ